MRTISRCPCTAVLAQIGIGAALVVPCLAGPGAPGQPFTFATNVPDGSMAAASRVGGVARVEIEAADDFTTTGPTTITSATFTGLLPPGAPLSSVTGVSISIYRVFPLDSTSPPPGNVPTRVNSPSDVEFASRNSHAGGGLTFSASVLAPSLTAANSVLNGIHPVPNQTSGGEGPVTGQEVQFTVTFTAPLVLPANHYFFVPQVDLSSGEFYWLSAPRPIVAPGTPFTPDLQAWTRNLNLDPDWLRVGTDIVGGVTPPTFNMAFTLNGGIGNILLTVDATNPSAVVVSSTGGNSSASSSGAGYHLRLINILGSPAPNSGNFVTGNFGTTAVFYNFYFGYGGTTDMGFTEFDHPVQAFVTGQPAFVGQSTADLSFLPFPATNRVGDIHVLDNFGNDTGIVIGQYLLIAPPPSPPGDPTSPSTPQTICAGSSTTISATPGTNADTIDWFSTSCGVGPVASGASIMVTPSGNTTYYARSRNSTTGLVSANCVSTTVGVTATSTITANVDLASITMGTFSRCISFDFYTPTSCPGGPALSTDVTMNFVNGHATAAIPVPCGTYTCVQARDRLHTLRRTAGGASLVQSGLNYSANFTTAAGQALQSGNLNDDAFIDILDFGGFISRVSVTYAAGGTPCGYFVPAGQHPPLHADFTGNGVVDAVADYTFITTQLFAARDPSCCGTPLSDGQPITDISIAALVARGAEGWEIARTADLNLDGRVNLQDVQFMGEHGLRTCAADFDGLGGVTVNDIFAFLQAWFAGHPAADINDDHRVGVQDIFDFLGAWFAGCG